eukprot:g5623.t1
MRAMMLLLVSGVVGAQAGAQVGVVFEQKSRTTLGDTTNGYYSSALWNEYLYDDATLAQDTNITGVQVWGYNFEYEQEIRVSFYLDNAGEIGAMTDSRVYSAGGFPIEPTGGEVIDGHWSWDEHLATFELDPPVRMDADRACWVSVQGRTELGWSYEALSGNSRIMYSNAAGSIFWDQNDTDMAFRLIGAEASVADLSAPYGVLDFSDVVAFLGAYASVPPAQPPHYTPGMKRVIPGVALLALSVFGLGACDDGSSGSSSASSGGALDNLADEPKSLYGKSAAMGRDLKEAIEQRDGAAQGLADQILGSESVEVAGLRWSVPEGWQAVAPSNTMRAAQLQVPHELGDSVVTFSTAGGTVQANLTRWGRQMIDGTGDPMRPRADVRDIAGLKVHVVEMDGTYLDGPPMGATTERAYYTLRGAIVEAPDGLVFIKMWGPEDAMDRAEGAWNTMISGMTQP